MKIPATSPFTPLQREARDLGQTPDKRLHIEGVRWGIEKGPDGKITDNGVFGDAFIEPSKVQDVFLVIKPFVDKPGNAPGHALLDFEFQPDAPVVDSQGHKDSGLVLSVEMHLRTGEDFDPADAIENPRPIMYQVGTWSDAIEKATVHDHDPLQRYKLKLTQEQKVSLLEERLRSATRDHSTDLYHPIINSCLSTVIDGVNLVVPEKQRIPHNDASGNPIPSSTIPIWCKTQFQSHGLLAQFTPEVIPAA